MLPSPPNLEGLYDFQREGVLRLREELAEAGAYLLGDEMGLGKTTQVLRTFERHSKNLIICPASLRQNWIDECVGTARRRGWRPDLNARIARSVDEIVPRVNELVVGSYELLPQRVSPTRLIHASLADVTVAVDEAHYVKNPLAQRTKRVRALAAQAGRVIGISGSPLPSRPLDLYGVLWALGLLSRSFGTWNNFIDVFDGRKDQWGKWTFSAKGRGPRSKDPWKPDLKLANELLRKVMLRRKRKEVLPDLPDKSYTDIFVEIAETETMSQAEAEWQLYGATELPPFEMFSKAMAEFAHAKIPAMLEQAERFEDEDVPLLVFSMHRSPLAVLADREGWAVIHGDTPTKKRQPIVDAFQNGELKGLGIAIKAGGVGLTLTRASHELFVDRSWTPLENAQAEDRTVRIGQEAKSVQVYRLVAEHPLERRLSELLDEKQALIEKVVD